MGDYEINRVLWDFKEARDRAAILADRAAFLGAYRLSDAEREAFLRPSFAALLDLGALPNLVFKYYVSLGLSPERYAERIRADRAAAARGG